MDRSSSFSPATPAEFRAQAAECHRWSDHNIRPANTKPADVLVASSSADLYKYLSVVNNLRRTNPVESVWSISWPDDAKGS